MCAEHADAPYDLPAAALEVEPARLRAIVDRATRQAAQDAAAHGTSPKATT